MRTSQREEVKEKSKGGIKREGQKKQGHWEGIKWKKSKAGSQNKEKKRKIQREEMYLM